MAISDSDKIDFLWKKVIFGVTRTANESEKSGSNETIPSPLPAYSTNIWTQADTTSIPSTPPTSNTSVITVYSSLALTADSTSLPAGCAWISGMSNFIPTTFGSNYQVRVYVGDPNNGGTRIYPDATGYEYVFDYVAGVLNFDNGIPANALADGIYISAYQYNGQTLAETLASAASKTSVVANIAARNALSPNTGDLVHVLDASGDPANAVPGGWADYLWTGSFWQCIANEASARTDALTQSLAFTYTSFQANSSQIIGTVGPGTRVVEISIEVTTTFDSGGVTVGDSGQNDRLLTLDDVDLTTPGVYVIHPYYQFPTGTDTAVNLYYSGLPTVGAANVVITWA